jgi:lysophospholipase L1-like esterase
VIEADTALISMGTNDGISKSSLERIRALRSRVRAKKVFWLAPGPQYPARANVFQVAMQFGDVVYERPEEDLAKDGIHYTRKGSRRIASLIAGGI